MDSEYLYERGLNNQSQTRLLEAKALAAELQDQFMLLKISVEEQQFFVDAKRRVDAGAFERLNIERESTQQNIAEEVQYLDLYIKLYIKVVQEFELKDKSQQELLKKEIDIQLLEEKNRPNAPRTERRFLLCNATYYRLLGKTDLVLQILK